MFTIHELMLKVDGIYRSKRSIFNLAKEINTVFGENSFSMVNKNLDTFISEMRKENAGSRSHVVRL